MGTVSDVRSRGIIHPIGRLHCKLRPGHWRLLLNHEDDFSPDLMEVGAIPDMIRTVAEDPLTIGYETPVMIESSKGSEHVRTLRINGVEPDQLGHAPYPFYRVYNVTYWTDQRMKNDHVLNLIRYLSEQVELMQASLHVVPARELRKLGWRFSGDELVFLRIVLQFRASALGAKRHSRPDA